MSLLPLLAAASLSAAEPRIELFTMGPGMKLFERFGHAAVCVVYDSAPERTRCYNYGTTNFASPPHELGWKFLRGTSIFWVSAWPREPMVRTYVRADRSVWRQELPLSAEQARQLAAKLAFDARKENRSYVYHHFRDNCCTRVRDIIDQVTHNSLLRATGQPTALSYRQLGRSRLPDRTGLLIASDLFVGRGADRHPSRYEAMFLPINLRREVALKLGSEPEVVHVRSAALPATEGALERYWSLGLVLLLALPLLAARLKERLRRPALSLVASLLGLLGLLVWAVAAISSVPELRYNEAALVFLPTDAALPFLRPRWLLLYTRVRLVGLALVSLLLVLGVLKQPLFLLVLAAALPLLLLLPSFSTIVPRADD